MLKEHNHQFWLNYSALCFVVNLVSTDFGFNI